MANRFKFFLSHLAISLLIALLVIGLVFFVWYPSPLATAVRGGSGNLNNTYK